MKPINPTATAAPSGEMDAPTDRPSPEMRELAIAYSERFGCNECREMAKTRMEIPHRESCRIGQAESALRKDSDGE